MCGIAGWIDYHRNILNQKQIREDLIKSMHHRGPDDRGEYCEDHINLLHCRLSIMDPENGKQPMHYGKYVICYNGELYNTKELKQQLQEAGYEFESNCDTEVLIKAYDLWKEEVLQRLNGIFAFTIWDKESKKAFMARDRLGVKPFFYTNCEQGILFASEIKTLLAHPQVKAIVSTDGIKELFLLGPARTRGKTPLDNIYELQAGECASYDEFGLTKKIYWKPQAKKHTENLKQTCEHLKELVYDSVNSQLDSDVGICTFLSGGLDSSIITKIASNRYSNLETFSIEYEENEKFFKKSVFQPNRDADFINIMVDDVKSNHHSFVLSQEEIVDALQDATRARDLPGMAEVDSSLLLFCEKIKEYKSVALSGEGADEILGGYPWYYNEEVLWKDEFPWSHSYDIRTSCLKDHLIEDGEAYIQQAYFNTIKDVSYLKEDDAKDRRMREMFYLNIRWFLQTLLDRKDRMSMYHALEVRVPFLDYRLVEYAYNMPWRYKSLNAREKGILREAFKGILPDEILLRKKSPYPKTHHPMYTKMLIEKIRTILKEDNNLSKVLDVDKVEYLIAHLDTIETPWYGQLMKGPQILAYFIQMHYFFEEYQVELRL